MQGHGRSDEHLMSVTRSLVSAAFTVLMGCSEPTGSFYPDALVVSVFDESHPIQDSESAHFEQAERVCETERSSTKFGDRQVCYLLSSEFDIRTLTDTGRWTLDFTRATLEDYSKDLRIRLKSSFPVYLPDTCEKGEGCLYIGTFTMPDEYYHDLFEKQRTGPIEEIRRWAIFLLIGGHSDTLMLGRFSFSLPDSNRI